MSPHQAFSTILRKLRNEAGISQEELAHRAGLDRNFVHFLESAKRKPTIDTIFKLASALQIAPSELIEMVSMEMEKSSD